MRLIHQYLHSGIMSHGVFNLIEEGIPQGGPLSPLLSNIMLNELDKGLERRGYKFVRNADDAMIFCGSRRDRNVCVFPSRSILRSHYTYE